MGLLDVLNGMQNGPRGQRSPGTASGGMSPMTMALLGLLAYKPIKSSALRRKADVGTFRMTHFGVAHSVLPRPLQEDV